VRWVVVSEGEAFIAKAFVKLSGKPILILQMSLAIEAEYSTSYLKPSLTTSLACLRQGSSASQPRQGKACARDVCIPPGLDRDAQQPMTGCRWCSTTRRSVYCYCCTTNSNSILHSVLNRYEYRSLSVWVCKYMTSLLLSRACSAFTRAA